MIIVLYLYYLIPKSDILKRDKDGWKKLDRIWIDGGLIIFDNYKNCFEK